MRVPRRKPTQGNSEGVEGVTPHCPIPSRKPPQLANVGHSGGVLKPPPVRGANSVGGKPGDRVVEWEELGKRGTWNMDGGRECPYGVMVKITDFYRVGERRC